MSQIHRVAVIGAGPAGAIAVDALAREQAFDIIRVFERRERAGGCWIYDGDVPTPLLENFQQLAQRTADPPFPIPTHLPAYTPKCKQPRYAETPTYSYLETNVDTRVMAFSQEPIPDIRSEASIKIHGHDTPFRHNQVISKWIAGLLERNGYNDFVEYNTTVERVEKVGGEWKLTLRRNGSGGKLDYWWSEAFDAVVVASGHYSVPFVPHIEGLAEFERAYPGSVSHSKWFRDPKKYKGKRVVVVGASVSAGDICTDLTRIAETPIHAVVRGKYNAYFGDEAFNNPHVLKHPEIERISPQDRTVHFKDGGSIHNVDAILLGTGYSWTLPFLPQIPVRNNRVPDLYLHIFYRHDPTLAFSGAIGAGLTFRAFEWQSVLIARYFAGRAKLPSKEEQQVWEVARIAKKGDGVPFTLLFPDFEEYFETVRRLAGEEGPGRNLPPFDKRWVELFFAGHERRKEMWRKNNKLEEERLKRKLSAKL
ncbi:hypothetical protein AX16_003052 [Volvariella volvacea WC 439]|nr:hypothetical protein AX16_003052 [Volvariella volvacea WC 439]